MFPQASGAAAAPPLLSEGRPEVLQNRDQLGKAAFPPPCLCTFSSFLMACPSLTLLPLTQPCPPPSSFCWFSRLCTSTEPNTVFSVTPVTWNSNIFFMPSPHTLTRLLTTQEQGFFFNSTLHSHDFEYHIYLHDSPGNSTNQTLLNTGAIDPDPNVL